MSEQGERRVLSPKELTELRLEAARQRDKEAFKAQQRAQASNTSEPDTNVELIQGEVTGKVVDVQGRHVGDILRLSKRKVLVGSLAVALGAGGVAIVTGGGEGKDDCTSTTKIEVEGDSWTDIAAHISELTGYTVTAGRAAQENIGVKPEDASCVNLPAPIVEGQLVADGNHSLQQLADAAGEEVGALLKLNKEVVDTPTAPIPAGTVIWTKPTLNKEVVLQPLDASESLQNLTGGKGDKVVELVEQNVELFVLSGELELKPGESYFLPRDAVPTAKLQQVGLSQAQIIKERPDAYDPAQRKKPEPIPTPSAEASKAPGAGQEAINPETGLTPTQEKLIASLDRTPEQKAFLMKVVAAVMRAEAHNQGVDPEVQIAQAGLESGWGTSDKAKYFNLTGIKVPKGWTGGVINLPTQEWSAAANAMVPATADWCVFADFDEWARQHILIQAGKEWYNDARNQPTNEETLKGLQNEVGPNREIITAGKLAYASDPNYPAKILDFIAANKINEIWAARQAATAEATPQQKNKIVLDPSKYPNTRDWKTWVPDTPVRVGDQMVNLKDIDPKVRIKMTEVNLNQATPSAQKYEVFKSQIIDLRATIAGDNFYNNFHGGKYGAPGSWSKVECCMINHFMAIPQQAIDNLSPVQLARSMQNGGKGVAVQAVLTKDGKVALLTDNYTQHTAPQNGVKYNGRAFGIEVAAAAQEGVTGAQYEGLVNYNTYFLIEGQFVKKGESVTPIVNKMILGHGEANDKLEGGHTDFPKIVMDQLRIKIVELLVEMGYTA